MRKGMIGKRVIGAIILPLSLGLIVVQAAAQNEASEKPGGAPPGSAVPAARPGGGGGMGGSFAPSDPPAKDPNVYPNPYVADGDYLKMPPGRTMGSSSSVAVDRAGNIWVVDRCAVNDCAGSTLDPVMQFAPDGSFVRSWGSGMFLFPHGLYIDRQDNLWIVDGHVQGDKGYRVYKMDHDGKVLMTLGKPGQGNGEFIEPNAVVVAPNGNIFVSEGHTSLKGPSRIQKFAPDGRYLMQWGVHGSGPGQLETPHTLAMDSKGRLFVGDRYNNRIQIFTQDGKWQASWGQFSRPSGIYIDENDILYVTDSESRAAQAYGHHPGWKRGIRVGSARTGKVDYFIPDEWPNPESNSTSGGEGIWASKGVIYSAQVRQKKIVRYVRK